MAKHMRKVKEYTITFTSDDIRNCFLGLEPTDEEWLTDEQCDQIAYDLEAMFEGYFRDWVRS